ncbi:MFS transporter [Micromonospora globbae]|uniref:MFS transporter n=1 Tax=Micromonospora globbae TaxID=1894969 RepID=UPI0034369A46
MGAAADRGLPQPLAATVAANIGTWTQTVGAQWLLIDAPTASTLVALVQTVSLLPTLLLALPAATLADTFDVGTCSCRCTRWSWSVVRGSVPGRAVP